MPQARLGPLQPGCPRQCPGWQWSPVCQWPAGACARGGQNQPGRQHSSTTAARLPAGRSLEGTGVSPAQCMASTGGMWGSWSLGTRPSPAPSTAMHGLPAPRQEPQPQPTADSQPVSATCVHRASQAPAAQGRPGWSHPAPVSDGNAGPCGVSPAPASPALQAEHWGSVPRASTRNPARGSPPGWDGESIQKARPHSRRPPAPLRPPQSYLVPSPCPVRPPPAAAPPRPARGAASSRPPQRRRPTLRDRQGRVSGAGRAAPSSPRSPRGWVRMDGRQNTGVPGQEWEGARRVGNTPFARRESDLSSQRQPGQGARGG